MNISSLFEVNSRIFEFEGDFIKISSHQYLVNPLTCGNQGKKINYNASFESLFN